MQFLGLGGSRWCESGGSFGQVAQKLLSFRSDKGESPEDAWHVFSQVGGRHKKRIRGEAERHVTGDELETRFHLRFFSETSNYLLRFFLFLLWQWSAWGTKEFYGRDSRNSMVWRRWLSDRETMNHTGPQTETKRRTHKRNSELLSDSASTKRGALGDSRIGASCKLMQRNCSGKNLKLPWLAKTCEVIELQRRKDGRHNDAKICKRNMCRNRRI